MKNIKMVVFDMAGTTVDEDNLVYKTVQLAIQKAGYEVTLEKVLFFAAGKEKLQAIKDVLTELIGKQEADEVAPNIFETFKSLLKTAYQQNTAKPMPNAEVVFIQLKAKGIKVVLNTGYNRETADTLLLQLGWTNAPFIDLTITASDVENGRPHPEMITLAMEKCDVLDASTVVKVGDSIVDIEEGLNAGCGVVVGITTGAQTAEQLWSANPTYVVNSLQEFVNHVLELESQSIEAS